jgi:stalled ribosome rescue protein Dom34
MWHVYNLIRPGDWMRTKTKRKITHVSENTGLKKTVKKFLTITLVIENIEYYCEGDRLCIRVKGKNIKQH